GGAALGEDLDGLEEESDGGLVAAEATGLEETEEAGSTEVLDRFAGNVAGGGGRGLAGAQGGDEGAGAREDVEGGGRSHVCPGLGALGPVVTCPSVRCV